ncbi:MAG: glucose 1-dehydrogenase [Planctomycetota bacterium]|nr:glucose 1-dehydrogenase [Planctomycetota bacterium]
MLAVAVRPGQKNSVHLRDDVRKPSVKDVPEGRGVLVKTLKVGVDATDREINDALYGNAPEGDDYLIIGHECFGIVEQVGSAVKHVKPGDYVTSTVRRNGDSKYDRIGRSDITSQEEYYERGINLRHGFMTEYFVDDAEFMVKIPKKLKHLHVLAEPMSCAAKAVEQAYLAQQRLQVWEPNLAFVTGSGQIGLLATLALRNRRCEVYTLARSPKPNLKARIAEGLGATYISTEKTSLKKLAKKVGKPDLIIDATGCSKNSFECMKVLAHNGALVWTSITGGKNKFKIDGSKINLEWVLGNKLLIGSVNANWRHFERGIADLALGEQTYPGVLKQILTHPVEGLENYQQMMDLLVAGSALKVYVNVADDPNDKRK